MPSNEVKTGTAQGVKLTQKDVSRSYWIWQLFSHANYNYERMQGGSFAACMERRGYGERLIRAIFYDNLARLLGLAPAPES